VPNLPLFLPQHLPAFKALEHFRQARPHVALVIDEHGGIAGLLTPTDVLEALVGDLAPSPGEPPNGPVQREDGSWLLDGLMRRDETAELFDLSEPEDEGREGIQTVAWLWRRLGRAPAPGDRFTWRTVQFEVMDTDTRRVDKVLANPSPTADA
jgi:putative hemolysin